MIEAVKEGKLPKNIRQIGQVTGNQKVYLEDYVITYLKQMSVDETMRVMILYGHKEMIGDELYWFVNGAVGAENDFFMQKTVIDEESWERVNEMAGKFFPELTVLGWAIIRYEPTKDIEDQIMRTQKQFFRSDQKLYFEYIVNEKAEGLFLYEKGKMKAQGGYYIYYERNECMQNYMVSLRAAERHPEEFEADRAAHQFREVSSEKKNEIHRRRTTTLMTCASLVLVMVIMVIGITMMNNYERMQSMEQVLYQISGKIGEEDGTDGNSTNAANAVVNDTQTAGANVLPTDPNVALADQGVLASDTNQATEVMTQPTDTVNQTEAQTDGQAVTQGDGQTAEQADPNATGDTAEAGQAGETDKNVGQPEAAPADNATTTQEQPEAAPTETAATQEQPEPGQAEEADDKQDKAADDSAESTISTNVETKTYVIQKGDTLASICLKYYGNLSNINKICELNHIDDKDNILYGQKIVLP